MQMDKESCELIEKGYMFLQNLHSLDIDTLKEIFGDDFQAYGELNLYSLVEAVRKVCQWFNTHGNKVIDLENELCIEKKKQSDLSLALDIQDMLGK